MKNQKGSTAIVILLAIIGFIVLMLGLSAMVAIGANNTANAFDQKVKYEHENNKNVLAQYNQKVMEVAQVPEMMRDDLIKVATAAMQGRYGVDGSKAVFQMLREQNPSVNPQLYGKIQQVIEGGRTEFQNAQTKLLDVKRAYETALGSFPQGMLMQAFGYPKVPLDQYNIVINESTDQAFKTGKEAGPIQLRPKQP